MQPQSFNDIASLLEEILSDKHYRKRTIEDIKNKLKRYNLLEQPDDPAYDVGFFLTGDHLLYITISPHFRSDPTGLGFHFFDIAQSVQKIEEILAKIGYRADESLAYVFVDKRNGEGSY